MDTVKNLIKKALTIIDMSDEHNRTFTGVLTALFMYFVIGSFVAWIKSFVEFIIFFILPAIRSFLMFMTGDAGFRFRVAKKGTMIVDRLSPEKSMLAVYFILTSIKLVSFCIYPFSFVPFWTTLIWSMDCLLFILALLVQIPIEFSNHVINILKKHIPIIGSYFDITLEGTLMDYMVYYMKSFLGAKNMSALNAIDDVIEKYDTPGAPDLTPVEIENFYDALDVLGVNLYVIAEIRELNTDKFDLFINMIGAKIGNIISSVIYGLLTGKIDVNSVIKSILQKLPDEAKKLN